MRKILMSTLAILTFAVTIQAHASSDKDCEHAIAMLNGFNANVEKKIEERGQAMADADFADTQDKRLQATIRVLQLTNELAPELVNHRLMDLHNVVNSTCE